MQKAAVSGLGRAGSFNCFSGNMMMFFHADFWFSLRCCCNRIIKKLFQKEKTRLINTVFFLCAMSHGRKVRYSEIKTKNF